MTPEVANKINNFFAKYKLQYFDKGQVIIHAGKNPDGIYYIIGGQIRQYDISPSGDEIVVNVFKPPAFFPMSWALNHTPNAYFFEAFTKVVARKAPAEDAVQFLRDNPDVTLDLLSRVYKGTDGLLARMAHLMQNSARARILFELVISCARFGKPQEDGSYTLNMHETELASRVGLTRETINREMRKLKNENIVEVTSHGISVNDVAAIKKEVSLEL